MTLLYRRARVTFIAVDQEDPLYDVGRGGPLISGMTATAPPIS